MIPSRIGTELSPFSRTAPFVTPHSHSAEQFPITSHSRIPICIHTYLRLVILCASLLASEYIYVNFPRAYFSMHIPFLLPPLALHIGFSFVSAIRRCPHMLPYTFRLFPF